MEDQAADTATDAIRARDVSKVYGDVRAVDDVDLTIETGHLHCLVGPNGSGKTTLFRMLVGLTSPTTGTVERPPVATGVGFQQPTFYHEFTVAENLDVFAEMVDADPGWRATLTDRFDLHRIAHRRAGALSGGQANKLDLVLGLLSEPRFLLLDEPLGDLDDVTRQEVVAFLDEYRTAERTVVVATHRLDAFDEVLDRLTVVEDGRVAFDAAGEELAAATNPRGAHDHYLDLLAE